MESLNRLAQSNLFFVLAGLMLVFLALLFWNIILQMKLGRQKNNLLSEEKTADLEKLLLNQSKNIKLLDKDIQELYNISNQINALAGKSLHRVGMIRFNPFKDIGGDQSFSLALLNGKNNGYTLSSLYSKEGARIYCKAITDGVSEKHPLTEEEKKAIQIAMRQDPKKI
jgi:hypothetical protein